MLALSLANESLVPLLCVLVAVTIGIWTLRRAQRNTRRDPSARDTLDRVREERQIRDSMSSLMVELEEYTRRLNAQLDTKSLKLEQLIQDADERIGRLQSAGPTRRPTPTPPTATPERHARAPVQPPAEPYEPPTDAARQVCALADAGKSSLQISQAVGLPLGEVELILNLKRAG